MYIPKEKIQEFAYRSHPFGKKCQCYSPDVEITILEKLQQNILDEQSKCLSRYNPQYRILTTKLKRENGVRIFREGYIERELVLHVKAVTKKFAKIIHNQKQL